MSLTPLPAGVDCIGLALDLEAKAKWVESQTCERAMLAAAHGLRLLDKLAPAVTWISVHDRLPPDRRLVLVWGRIHLLGSFRERQRCLGMTRFNPSSSGGKFDVEDSRGNWIFFNVVTHWSEVQPPARLG